MSTLDASSADAAHVPGLWRIEQNPDDDAESFEERAGGSIGPFVMVADNPHFPKEQCQLTVATPVAPSEDKPL